MTRADDLAEKVRVAMTDRDPGSSAFAEGYRAVDDLVGLVSAAEKGSAHHTEVVADYVAQLEELDAEREAAERELRLWLAWSNDQRPDHSPGDVIAAELDGTIVLDDGITTWNPLRAGEFFNARAVAAEARVAELVRLIHQPRFDDVVGIGDARALAVSSDTGEETR